MRYPLFVSPKVILFCDWTAPLRRIINIINNFFIINFCCLRIISAFRYIIGICHIAFFLNSFAGNGSTQRVGAEDGPVYNDKIVKAAPTKMANCFLKIISFIVT